jgi:hypothetical protein
MLSQLQEAVNNGNEDVANDILTLIEEEQKKLKKD